MFPCVKLLDGICFKRRKKMEKKTMEKWIISLATNIYKIYKQTNKKKMEIFKLQIKFKTKPKFMCEC